MKVHIYFQPGIIAAIVVTSLSVATAMLFPCHVQAEAPNIILILSDDAGYADFGVTGDALVPTPHIDQLAKEGILCSQGYVTASTCTPSRMGLMSGRYQQRFGAECNVPTIPTPGYTKDDLGLDTGETRQTLLEKLKNWEETLAQPRWYDGANWKHWQREQVKNHKMTR